MTHILDRPAWSALNTRHAHLALGDSLAKRYPGSIVPFAATGDDGAESLRALEEIVRPGDPALMVQVDDIILPPGLSSVSTAVGVQMVANRPPEAVSDGRLQRLTEADAREMFELASLTRPGPFTLRALSLGDFWGVKEDGRLVAMAGERMKQPGYTELSGVCSHPDFRGRGLGRLLFLFVAGQICGRGETPYLHAYATNTGAINLYESLGFKLRCRMNVAEVRRTA